jgi:hypothetical protein
MKLDVKGLARRTIGSLASFATNNTLPVALGDGEEIIGCYKNSENRYLIITSEGVRLSENGEESSFSYKEMSSVEIPILWQSGSMNKNWKSDMTKHKHVRQIKISLVSGKTIFIPIENDTDDGFDVLCMKRFLGKILAFELKQRSAID